MLIYAVETEKKKLDMNCIGAICSQAKIKNEIAENSWEKNPENCTLSAKMKYDQLVSNSVWLYFSGILSSPFVSFISRLIACLVACSFNKTLCSKMHPSCLIHFFNYLAVRSFLSFYFSL